MESESGRAVTLERQKIRYYDEKFGLWYVVYWDDILECFVTQLESGQRAVISSNE